MKTKVKGGRHRGDPYVEAIEALRALQAKRERFILLFRSDSGGIDVVANQGPDVIAGVCANVASTLLEVSDEN